MAEPLLHLGKYADLSEIGRGGFGVVYRAADTTLNRRPVALKVLAPHLLFDPQAVARFKQEAGLAANLQYPNIVMIYEVGEEQGQNYIAMQLIEGQSLAQILKESGALPIERVIPIVQQLADALDYAHAQGVIHRDIKPSNILISKKNDHVTLTDFGLARMTEASGLSSVGQIIGTPTYMAPEQLDPINPQPPTAQTDIYSLGVVVYEMLAGRPPFIGPMSAIVTGHLQLSPPILQTINPSVPKYASEAISKALAKKAERRYQHAREMCDMLGKEEPAKQEPEYSSAKKSAGGANQAQGTKVQEPKTGHGARVWLIRLDLLLVTVLGIVVAGSASYGAAGVATHIAGIGLIAILIVILLDAVIAALSGIMVWFLVKQHSEWELEWMPAIITCCVLIWAAVSITAGVLSAKPDWGVLYGSLMWILVSLPIGLIFGAPLVLIMTRSPKP